MTDSLNKIMVGWDEILQGGIPKDAVVMSWRGVNGGYEAANRKHDVIMASMLDGLYLCNYQGAIEVEPAAASNTDFAYLKDIYVFDPVPDSLSEEYQKYIIGTQCCAWTEWTSGVDNLEYILYPRLVALAEMSWTQIEYKNWENFKRRLINILARLDKKDVNYHIPIPEGVLTKNKVITKDSVVLCFQNSLSLPMVYTLDGTEPDEYSQLVPGQMVFKDDVLLKVATLLPSGKISKIRSIQIEKQLPIKALEKELDSKVYMKVATGLFCNEHEYSTAVFYKDTMLKSLSSYGNVMYSFKKPSLSVYTGEFFIPETGVYTFSSNVDELWIANKRLIYNPTSSRFYAQKVELNLEKGVHPFKILFSNRIKEGFGSCWYPIDFKYVSKAGKEYIYN